MILGTVTQLTGRREKYRQGGVFLKLEHIKLFIDVVQSGSITQAAKQGFITQQGLSLALKQIEKELTINLFYRSNKGVRLTSEGQKFFDASCQMVRIYNDFLYDIHDDGRNDVFNLYLPSSVYKRMPSLNEAPFAKRNGWYFSYVERSAAEIIELINDNKGIGLFCLHGASDQRLLERLRPELTLYDLGSEDRMVYVCDRNSELLTCAIEELPEILAQKKCVISSSEHDLIYPFEKIRNTFCVPDIHSHKQLLKTRDVYSMMTFSMYKTYFEPTEYGIFMEQAAKVIRYFVVFNLKKNDVNLRLERELVSYLKEVLNTKS